MQRTLALGALWLASAAAAVGLGLLAVSLLDASASPGTIDAAATVTQTAPEVTPTAAGSATAEYATEAGTVFADCTAGQPVLAGAPAAGWWIDGSDDPAQVQFENGSQKLEVHVVCGSRGPQFSVEGPRSDEGGGDDGVAVTSGSTTPAGPTGDDHRGDSGDDSSGRDGGGHGSDD